MTRSRARAKALPDIRARAFLTAGIMLAVLVIWGKQVAAQSDDIIISHGYSFYGDLTYQADYTHFDYVNPDAPKGGEISLWSQGTFDSFNIYTRQGVPAAGTTIIRVVCPVVGSTCSAQWGW
jgi:microcin C transport system substrate-binding protein